MWCYERRRKKERKKEESRDKNSPKAFGELKIEYTVKDIQCLKIFAISINIYVQFSHVKK